MLLRSRSTSLVCWSCVTSRNFFLSTNLRAIRRYPVLKSNELQRSETDEECLEDMICRKLKGKLIYNSVIASRNLKTRWRLRTEQLLKEMAEKNIAPVPVSLKYIYDVDINEYTKSTDQDSLQTSTESEEIDDEAEKKVNFPYSIVKQVDVQPSLHSEVMLRNIKFYSPPQDIVPNYGGRKWMSDYDVYSENQVNEEVIDTYKVDYGTPDPRMPASEIPCGGCGAFLHCQNPSVPGYVPKELFGGGKKRVLQNMICQRCHFLKQYNTALSVSVDPESYVKLISSLKYKEGLILWVVDMTDFPCSIWPEMLRLIGEHKKIIIVGNKIDLVPGDCPGWLDHAKVALNAQLPKKADILHVALVSAKTGYGIEQLITKIFTLWSNKGDVYIVGCTNVGKSTLFNALLQSDYCKVHAIDLIQRATTSPWPGTTLNLLKFPITKALGWKLFFRTKRLIAQNARRNEEYRLQKLQSQQEKMKMNRLPQIIGQIGLTMEKPAVAARREEDYGIEAPTSRSEISKSAVPVMLDPNSIQYRNSKWCYDTPGVVHPEQIINLLTNEELTKLVSQKTIQPRFISVRPNQTVLIAGLARIDLLSSEERMVRLIIYASQDLPITLCETDYVDDVYNTLLGTSFLAVPCGSMNRLLKWPELKYKQDFELSGYGGLEVTSDVVLSSVGWVSLMTKHFKKAVIRPWTPDGKGIFFRDPPLLRFSGKRRKKRISNTPCYFVGNA